MFRLISILFLLAGIGFVGWGAMRYYEAEKPGGYETASAPEEAVIEYNVTESAALPSIEDEATEYIGDAQAYASAEDVEMDPAEREAIEEAFEEAMGPDGLSGLGSNSDIDDFRPSNVRSMARESAAFEVEIVTTANAPQSILDRLRTVPIAHETPASARYNRSFEVTVAIDATGDDTAADALPGTGNIVEGEAQVLDKAQATLSGSAFEIDLISPSIQTVSPMTENVWRWKVRPVETGMHQLRIELFALDGDEALPVRTFTDNVEVKVSRIGQFMAKADEFDPLFMILGGVGSLLAGLFGVVRFFRGR